MLKFFPKDVLAQWAVGSVAVAGAAGVAYVVVFPPQDAPQLPRPEIDLSAPAVSEAPSSDTPSDVKIAAMDAVRAAAPQFDIVRVTDLGNVLLAGKAPPRAQVAALIDEAQVANTVSTGAGEFVMMFDVLPSRTPRVLELEVRLPEGGRVRSADTIMLTPSAAAMAGVNTDAPAGMVAREVATTPAFSATRPKRPPDLTCLPRAQTTHRHAKAQHPNCHRPWTEQKNPAPMRHRLRCCCAPMAACRCWAKRRACPRRGKRKAIKAMS